MLDYLNEGATAKMVQGAIAKVYADGTKLTRDVGGTSGTREFADAVVAAL